MSDVPLELTDLEQIVGLVSQELLEKLAIDNDIADEEMSNWAMMSVDITTFVINSYMGHVNNLMTKKALSGIQW